MRAACRFEELFTQHLLIAADLVNAAKSSEINKANAARDRWYNNADEIAGFLSSINPCWSKDTWECMLYSHLEMTEKEAILRLQGNYTAISKCLTTSKTKRLKWLVVLANIVNNYLNSFPL